MLACIKKILFIITFIQFNTVCLSQTVTAEQLYEADDLFRNKSYAAAAPVYLALLQTESDHPLFNYKAGVCYLHSRSLKRKAVNFLEKAAKNSTMHLAKSYANDKDAPPDVYKLLGDAYYLNYDFAAAIKSYDKYKNLLNEQKDPDEAELKETAIKIEMCRLVKELKPTLTLPLAAKTGKPCQGDLVKGTYNKTLSTDKKSMVYTVEVPLEQIESDDSTFYEPLSLSADSLAALKKRQTPTKKTKKNLELDTVVYASTIGTSFDGQVMLSYKNDDGEGNLYITRLKNNKWTRPSKVVKSANPAGWEPNECISADGSTMYFVSDREGGFGGADIYKCTRMPNGEWSKAENLGPSVNTAADELAPVIHPNGKTLYFSSNRVKPASYDIFSYAVNNNEQQSPVNIGYPINRHEHDIFQVTADNKKIFPASKPAGEKLKKKNTDTTYLAPEVSTDHLLISFIDQQKTPLTVRKGQVKASEARNPLGASITISDNATGKTIGQYHAEAKTGLYSLMLPVGKNLNITYAHPGYLFCSENVQISNETNYFETPEEINMQPMAEGATVQLNNIFFEDNTAAISKLSALELGNLAAFIKIHPNTVIEISNVLYSQGQKKFYKRLSKDRAEAIASALTERGVEKKQLAVSGHRLSLAKADTEKKAKVKNKTSAAIQKKGTQKQADPKIQLVEIKILKIK